MIPSAIAAQVMWIGQPSGTVSSLPGDKTMPEKTFAELLDETTEKSRMMDAPLSERLKAVADEVTRLSPEFAGVVARMVARLEANNVGQSAPQVGEPMPDFILPDEAGRLVRLENLLGPVSYTHLTLPTIYSV